MNNVIGLTPLLSTGLSIYSALIFVAAFLFVLTLTSLIAWLLRNAFTASTRTIATAALIASATGVANLLAQAMLYAQAQPIEWLLLLIASNCMLFIHIDRILSAQFASFGAMVKNGGTFALINGATLLLIAAVVQLSGSDNALPAVFMVAALLIALHRRFLPQPTPPATHTPRKRVRVTGAVR